MVLSCGMQGCCYFMGNPGLVFCGWAPIRLFWFVHAVLLHQCSSWGNTEHRKLSERQFSQLCQELFLTRTSLDAKERSKFITYHGCRRALSLSLCFLWHVLPFFILWTLVSLTATSETFIFLISLLGLFLPPFILHSTEEETETQGSGGVLSLVMGDGSSWFENLHTEEWNLR